MTDTSPSSLEETCWPWWPAGILTVPNGARPDWSDFAPVQLNSPSGDGFRKWARAADLTEAEAKNTAAFMAECAGFVNSIYIVLIRLEPANERCTALWHMMIERRDGERVGIERYADFMRIRDELVGPDHEAVEV